MSVGGGGGRIHLTPKFTLPGKSYKPSAMEKILINRQYQTGTTPTGWAAATKLQGKELSYNNLVDLEARRLILEFTEPCAAAILKHTNPCVCGTGNQFGRGIRKGFQCRLCFCVWWDCGAEPSHRCFHCNRSNSDFFFECFSTGL